VQIDFRSSERSSLGVEVELEIVDLESRELRSGASELLPLLGRDHPNGEHPKAKHKLLESTVEIIPVREAIEELVDELMPVARRLGCSDELHNALSIMERGPSYIRQREVIAAGGAMTDVVDSLVRELRTDRLTPTPKPAIP